MKLITLFMFAMILSACGSEPMTNPAPVVNTDVSPKIGLPETCKGIPAMSEDVQKAIKQLNSFLKDADMYRKSHKKPVVLEKDEEALKTVLNYIANLGEEK